MIARKLNSNLTGNYRMARLTPESKVKAKVIAALKGLGVFTFFPATHGYGTSGMADIIGCVDGLFIAVEVKADKTKKPTKLQVLFGDRVVAHGGFWMVVCDEQTIDEMVQRICSLLNRQKQLPSN